ncbi:hypothetical protein P775_22290 [Puniceibacterium antarcticum]|uniref:Uncharacterized protein n=1 Tax=Puniceibacterium antarcticum TaxID=1206336 RepID=A0A2G8R8T1_9RHOB|nr:hypothetical protein P775_22290 [Puniceibacterium antarcticum]
MGRDFDDASARHKWRPVRRTGDPVRARKGRAALLRAWAGQRTTAEAGDNTLDLAAQVLSASIFPP